MAVKTREKETKRKHRTLLIVREGHGRNSRIRALPAAAFDPAINGGEIDERGRLTCPLYISRSRIPFQCFGRDTIGDSARCTRVAKRFVVVVVVVMSVRVMAHKLP